MSMADVFWYAWPWVGLGMGIVMLVLLFATDLMRESDAPRWRDPYWLAWAAMPAYLVHQFEEYALNIVDGHYVIVEQVFVNAGSVMDLSALPMFHFPLVNIALVWAGVPLAAWLGARLKNPVVALSPYGGFEQVGSLGRSYPANDTRTTTKSGDIMLYASDQIVLFYGENTWAYTRLGKIDLPDDEVTRLLTQDNITLTLSAE